LISFSDEPPSPLILPRLLEILGIDEMFDIFDIFVENPEDYQHIIRFPSDEIFDIFDMLGTVRDVWVAWDDDLPRRQNSAQRMGKAACRGSWIA
jgi:hypothetical protein